MNSILCLKEKPDSNLITELKFLITQEREVLTLVEGIIN